jgi:hypothetical protein
MKLQYLKISTSWGANWTEAKLMNIQFLWGVSGHNLESPQTLGFCMDSLTHREGGVVFYQVSFFLLYSL